MPEERSSGRPRARRYSDAEKAAVVWTVLTLEELGVDRGRAVRRVASRMGCAVASVRRWVEQAEIAGDRAPRTHTSDAQRITELMVENRELRRENEILRRTASLFGAELDRHHRR